MSTSSASTALQAFSLERAYAMATAAELAYEQSDRVHAAVYDEWGFQHCRFFESDNTQAFTAADENLLVVSFRGTEAGSFADWLTDADFTLIDGPLGGCVHEGFYDALADIWQLLDAEVAKHADKSLWITGHSLGGALAALAAARWYEAGRTNQGVYTFGQPRTGDKTFARNFNFAMKATSFRFVNDNDLVTRVPPRTLGFAHLGTFQYFSDAGGLEQDVSCWQMFLDRWTFHWGDFLDGTLESTEDHSMTAYRRLISAAKAKQPLQREIAHEDTKRHLRFANQQPPSIQPRRRAA